MLNIHSPDGIHIHQLQTEDTDMSRKQKAAIVLACMGALLLAALALPRLSRLGQPPGLAADDRVLLRIWVVSAPGGGQAWLKAQLRAFEKQHPQVSTWLRIVPAEELTNPDAVLPDVMLYMPGDLTAPDSLFLPLSGEMLARENPLLREELLRCGRWRNQQYGLPLCWSAWVLAIDSALEPGSAVTPAPTTLLGKPAATRDVAATPTPGYPLAAAMQAECALQSPGGAALFTLGMMLEESPALPDNFGTLTSGEVYAAFQRRQCATALLTTGQVTALNGIVGGGGGFPFRVITPQEIVTDQVWLASVTENAPEEAALLLSHLASAAAQETLAAQGLHTVRQDLTLYAAGVSAEVEQTGRKSLTVVNAYQPSADVQAAAWQFFQRRLSLDEALLPLM